jgi:hypothetical protein
MHVISQRRAVAATALLLVVQPVARPLVAQTDYDHTDAGRPIRVEDAVATERHALDVQLAPLRLERTAAGLARWRFEPKVSYGALARTEVEVRTALAMLPRQGDAVPARAGLTGVGLSALRALTLETPRVPALALGADVLAPVGSLAAPRATYSLKAMLTRSFRLVRVHVNGAVGTWSVAPPAATSCTGAGCGTSPLPFIPDTPCDVAPYGDTPSGGSPRTVASARCGAPPYPDPPTPFPAPRSGPDSTATARTNGARWFAGVALDHAFAVHSLLVSADLYAERIVGLYTRTDWATEVGVRRQVTPTIVLDAGAGRRFAGVNRATLATFGATLTMATRPLLR